MYSFFKKYFTKHSSLKIGGFTLIEMLVVISIVIIISTVVLLNFPKYSANQQIQLAAQDVLTTIREAQYYGIAVKGQKVGAERKYSGQGIYIKPDLGGTGTPTYDRIMTYVDADYYSGGNTSNQGFNSSDCTKNSTTNPCFVKLMSEPIKIKDFCITPVATPTTEKCFLLTGSNKINAIDILFQRPEPEPIIWGFDDAGNPFAANNVKIILEAQVSNGIAVDGIGQKTITVYDTGHASISGENATETIN